MRQLSPGNLRRLQDEVVALRAAQWATGQEAQREAALTAELRASLARLLRDRDEVRAVYLSLTSCSIKKPILLLIN